MASDLKSTVSRVLRAHDKPNLVICRMQTWLTVKRLSSCWKTSSKILIYPQHLEGVTKNMRDVFCMMQIFFLPYIVLFCFFMMPLFKLR